MKQEQLSRINQGLNTIKTNMKNLVSIIDNLELEINKQTNTKLTSYNKKFKKRFECEKCKKTFFDFKSNVYCQRCRNEQN